MATETITTAVTQPDANSTGPSPARLSRVDLQFQWLVTLISLTLGAMFLYAGIAKMQHPYDFLSSLYGYRLFTRDQAILLARFIPPLEIVTGLALLSRLHLTGALLISTVLSASFVVVRAWAWKTGVTVDCNCFGAQVLMNSESVIDWRSIAVSALQLFAALGAFLFSFSVTRNDSQVRRFDGTD